MTITIELPDSEAQAFAAKARAQGLSARQYAHEIVRRDLEDPAKKPLSAKIREIWSDMPSDIRPKLPADAASQIDRYVYGLPKKRQ